MDPVLLSIDSGWAAGLVLAIARVAAFVVSSPIMARAFPPLGRFAFTIAIGAALTRPVASAESLWVLLSAAVVNLVVGFVLGWLTGAVFNLFAVAGGVVDFGSGLAVSQVFDPGTGAQAAVFTRWLPLSGLAVFMVTGGLPVIVAGLYASLRAVPLDGALAVNSDLGAYAIAQVSQLFVLGIELALPLAATLLVIEVLLGLMTRFAPQVNAFLLGLPAKIWATLTVLSVVILRFPAVTTNVIAQMEEAFVVVLRGLVSAGT